MVRSPAAAAHQTHAPHPCKVRVSDLLPGAKIKLLSPSNIWVTCTVLEPDSITGQFRVRCDAPDTCQQAANLTIDKEHEEGTLKLGDETEKRSKTISRCEQRVKSRPSALSRLCRTKSDTSIKREQAYNDNRRKSSDGDGVAPRNRETMSRKHSLLKTVSLSREGTPPEQDEDTLQCIVPPLPARKRLRVALYAGAGTSQTRHELIRVLRIALDARDVLYSIDCLTAVQVATKLAVEHYDVVIFPGGKTKAQLAAIGEDEIHTVQKFIHDGGGFIGTCAGGVLALERFEFFGSVFQKHPWDRGMGNVYVEFTDPGLVELRLPQKERYASVFYGQGPIVAPDLLPENVEILAHYRSEISSRHSEMTKGEMMDTPAVYASNYGLGRVVVSSAHPELTESQTRSTTRSWVGTDSEVAPDMYYGFLACVAPLYLEL